MAIEVVPVRSKRDLRRFIKFPWTVYRNDPNWVPPLISEMKKFLDPNKNPFFEHADVELFLAEEDDRVLGRIAAIVNHNHIELHDEQAGFFGFFEVLDRYEVAERLLATACDWLRNRGMEIARGPANFSSNDEWALLIEGFDEPPVVMMPYNPKYYIDFLERFGFKKAKDLFAYVITEEDLPEKLVNLINWIEVIKRRKGITIRKGNMKAFDQEVEIIKEIYNSAWEKNWGFVPMTDREVQHLASNLRRIIDPDFAFFAEIGGEPVGFALSIPDINQALIRINGRLFPFGIFKLLWASRKIDTLRFILIGTKASYRNMGINALFYYEMFHAGQKKGYKKADFSWVLEDNTVVTSILEKTGSKIKKKYRVYDFQLH
ncbi:MAG: N-acetyltransferase [Candidatus Bipolaricaulia bacterium]